MKIENLMNSELSYISLGGIGEVTKNLHVYEIQNEILLVDCGLGFPDETMVGIDLLLPDIDYLLQATKMGKKIVGMLITHGHEDHMGGLPFVLPQLPEFPIFSTSFTSVLANEKLKEFGLVPAVKKVSFNQDIKIGTYFTARFIHVTHSVPDTAHIFLKTSVGNFYHGSDFKFDLTPVDGRKTDFQAIAKAGMEGVRCLLSECLGAGRLGITASDNILTENFEKEMRQCKGKFVITTYSSNISRINQICEVAQKLNKYVCFVGRSLIKAKEAAKREGLLKLSAKKEISADTLSSYHEKDIVLFVAGSQGQENSALTRITFGDHREIALHKDDVVVFSSDPIPGNEVSVYTLIDQLAKLKIKILHSDSAEKFHVSGHGSQHELLLLMSLLKPKQVLPISGDYRHMASYNDLAKQFGYLEKDIILTQSGQEVIFGKDYISFGKKIALRNIYVDEVSGEEVEHYILHDRQKISQEGIIAVIAEVESETGMLSGKSEVVTRGLAPKEAHEIEKLINNALHQQLRKPLKDYMFARKRIREIAERTISKEFKRQPLILPVVIEV